MNTTLSKEEQIALVALQGLLASGHYTMPATDEEGSEEPSVIRSDHGSDWKRDGYNRKMSVNAVVDAFLIARDFAKQSAEEQEFAAAEAKPVE